MLKSPWNVSLNLLLKCTVILMKLHQSVVNSIRPVLKWILLLLLHYTFYIKILTCQTTPPVSWSQTREYEYQSYGFLSESSPRTPKLKPRKTFRKVSVPNRSHRESNLGPPHHSAPNANCLATQVVTWRLWVVIWVNFIRDGYW